MGVGWSNDLRASGASEPTRSVLFPERLAGQTRAAALRRKGKDENLKFFFFFFSFFIPKYVF